MPVLTDNPTKPDAADKDQSKYLIYSRLEIATILNTLAAAGTMVTAYFGGDNDFILTSIIALKPEQDKMFVDCGADEDANQRALRASKITFVAAHNRIKIQFIADSLRSALVGGRAAFSTAMPETLLRLQRREYFRITTPLTRPLRCLIGPQGKPAPAEVSIVDISCGGIAIIDSIGPAGIDTGARYRGCRILLPELGEVSADIMVRSTFEVSYRNGAKHRRAGCEFVNMRERDRALIQRYISRLERARKERTGAL